MQHLVDAAFYLHFISLYCIILLYLNVLLHPLAAMRNNHWLTEWQTEKKCIRLSLPTKLKVYKAAVHRASAGPQDR